MVISRIFLVPNTSKIRRYLFNRKQLSDYSSAATQEMKSEEVAELLKEEEERKEKAKKRKRSDSEDSEEEKIKQSMTEDDEWVMPSSNQNKNLWNTLDCKTDEISRRFRFGWNCICF